MSTTCAAQPRILIADDQSDLLDALRLLLKGNGIQMEAVTSPEAALAAVERRAYDLLLMDLNYTGDTTSGREGIDLLARVQALDSLLPIVVMTGWGSVDLAVESMRRGVRDFVQKPWDNHQLLATLRTEIDRGRARRQEFDAQKRDFEEARRIQRKLLPTTLPQLDGWEIAASWQPAAGVGGDCFDAIAVRRIAYRAVDRGRRGQGHPRGPADVEPAGRRARVCDRRRPSRRTVPAGQSHPVRQHRRGALHQLLLLRGGRRRWER